MFHCPTCRKTVFQPECTGCGFVEDNVDEVAAGFVEYLRTGEYQRPEPDPPAPFRKRLAAFVQREESEVMLSQSKQSTMPLRVLGPIGPYVGPKSNWLIRLILTRIQRLVRGASKV